MEIASFSSDWAIVSLICTGSRLVLGLQREGTIESTVRIPRIRLRFRSYPDRVPALEEILCAEIKISGYQPCSMGLSRILHNNSTLLTHDRILVVREAGPYRPIGPMRRQVTRDDAGILV